MADRCIAVRQAIREKNGRVRGFALSSNDRFLSLDLGYGQLPINAGGVFFCANGEKEIWSMPPNAGYSRCLSGRTRSARSAFAPIAAHFFLNFFSLTSD